VCTSGVVRTLAFSFKSFRLIVVLVVWFVLWHQRVAVKLRQPSAA